MNKKLLTLNSNVLTLTVPELTVSSLTGATNLGGVGIFSEVNNYSLKFKGLVAGNNITLTPSSTGITINTNVTGYVANDLFTGYTATTEIRLDNIEANINYLSGQTDQRLKISTFAAYSATTQSTINGKVNSSLFNTYTGTTAPAQFASKSNFNTFTGTTAPATYLSISNFNTYSGVTLTNINSRLLKSDFNIYTGNTISSINSKLNTSIFNTYTGTTAPATYYNKTQINSYTGATATAIGLKANIASPTFTGVPISTTAAVDTNTTQIATTAFVLGQAANANPIVNGTVAIGTSLRYARQDHVHATDTSRAALASPTFTGVPAAPTAAVNTNTTQLATTAFVVGQAGTANPLIDGTVAVGTSLRYAREDHRHATDTTRAALASPTFTGIPAAPTAAVDTNTTQIATTAFVLGQSSNANPLINGTVAQGTSLRYSRQDHVHPTDTTRAALASPTFTGVPAAPTAAANTNTTQLATTAFVISQIATTSVYGTQYQLASDLTSTSTTSTTPVAKVTMTTSSLPSGTYKIIVHWMWSRDSAANSARFNVTINSTPQGTRDTMEMEGKDTTDIRPETRIFYSVLSGVNTIKFNHWAESNGNSTTTSDATIELIRVA